MARYRLARASQADIASILAWSEERFGREARQRYEALIVTSLRDAAAHAEVGRTPRPDLGGGVFVWHLSSSRTRSPGGRVHRPRHFLICRREGDMLIVGRVLHDAMDLRRHVDPGRTWD